MEKNELTDDLNQELKNNEQPVQMYEEMMRAIGNIILAKDKDVFEHTSRVVYYAKTLAKELGWDEERIQWVEIGGFLHDIGKIGIPDSILNKRGALTKEEYEYIKKHPDIGADMIRGISFLKNSIDAILTHQERYDGKGYPKGLKGNDIPEIGRILAIADAFDAMTSDRAYRKGMPKHKAIMELKNNAGIQFDPVFVKIFCDILETKNYEHKIDVSEDITFKINSEMIEYACLNIGATKSDIKKLCKEAIEYKYNSVCVNPIYVSLASECLKDSGIGITSVIAYPLGAIETECKIYEAKRAIKGGATELDIVIDIGAIKNKEYMYIEMQINKIKKIIRKKVKLNIIVEANILTDEEKREICSIAKQQKVNYIKPSTGFVEGGAVVSDIELIKQLVGDEIKIKASGAKTLIDVKRFIEAGASKVETNSLLIFEG